ncbi:MAG: hypothetical protein D6717_14470 [Gammaproteobacteria bacterium]|nr:MAG: hypothetical protein D6717_14470 [Gammaproteobacteria bacterium]
MKKQMTQALLAGLLLSLSASPILAKSQAELGQDATQRAQRETGRNVNAQRERIEQEAIDALMQTQAALAALDKGDKKAALDALAKATGKLELLVSRHPKLGLIPVDITIDQVDLIAPEKAIKEAIDEAEDALEDGEVQKARHILQGLASEMVVRTTSIPLATYPDAIKAVSPLIDAGKIDEARDALIAALNTLVVTEEIIPLPVLRATIMLRDADALAQRPSRSDEDQKLLEALLDAAKAQIRYAELLGYGKHADYKPLYKEIGKIRKQVANKQHGKGLFDRIREGLKALGKHSQKTEGDAS